MPSPLGDLDLIATDEALTALWFGAPCDAPFLGVPTISRLATHPVLARAASQLAEYFAGTRSAFELPLAPAGTPFQQAVWRALLAIPYGTRCAYRDIAIAIGHPTATRAVGAANGKNPLGIIVPCHRVVGADGALTGYAGGLEAKRWLLRHEAEHTAFALAPSGGEGMTANAAR
jgi:methylated-DNA-[protein]-cysteine S-methyltransferase